jgi:NTE family protein
VPESIGLVLAGGGARGAYEVGVLSVLLPWLEREHGQRPDVIVGTSVGALNAAFLAAHADRDTPSLVQDGTRTWREIGYRDVLVPVLSLRGLIALTRLAISLTIRDVGPYSLLDPAPLARTLARLIDFSDIHRNVVDTSVGLRACAVVATLAHSNRTVVFHDGGRNPPSDERRRIDYVESEIGSEHVRASAAIPVAFPGVEVQEPPAARGWYFDGGTRLNTPIKPALELEVDRVIVVGLNSLAPAPGSSERPDIYDGASQIVQGLLVDPVVHDVQTLATINETLMQGSGSAEGPRRVVPYIFVAPASPNQIGEIAREVYNKQFAGLRGLRSRDLAALGRVIRAGRSPTRGELFSYFFFASVFAERLIELGRADATRWIQDTHDDGAWQCRPLPSR